MTATATLTHDFPDGPRILSPVAGPRVRPDQVVVIWSPVTTPAGIDIEGYQVLVVQAPALRVFSVDLPATATQVKVPPSSSNAAPTTRLRSWPSRLAATRPSPVFAFRSR